MFIVLEMVVYHVSWIYNIDWWLVRTRRLCEPCLQVSDRITGLPPPASQFHVCPFLLVQSTLFHVVKYKFSFWPEFVSCIEKGWVAGVKPLYFRPVHTKLFISKQWRSAGPALPFSESSIAKTSFTLDFLFLIGEVKRNTKKYKNCEKWWR